MVNELPGEDLAYTQTQIVVWLGCRYFRRLQRRYTPLRPGSAGTHPAKSAAEADESAWASDSASEDGSAAPSQPDASLLTPVTCINLLRCSMQRKVSLRSLWESASCKEAFMYMS